MWKFVEDGEFPKSSSGWTQVLVITKKYMRVLAAGIDGDAFSYAIAMYKKKDGFCIDGLSVDDVVCWSYLEKMPKRLHKISKQKHISRALGANRTFKMKSPSLF